MKHYVKAVIWGYLQNKWCIFQISILPCLQLMLSLSLYLHSTNKHSSRCSIGQQFLFIWVQVKHDEDFRIDENQWNRHKHWPYNNTRSFINRKHVLRYPQGIQLVATKVSLYTQSVYCTRLLSAGGEIRILYPFSFSSLVRSISMCVWDRVWGHRTTLR